MPRGDASRLIPAKKGEVRNPTGKNGAHPHSFAKLVNKCREKYPEAFKVAHERTGVEIDDPHEVAALALFDAMVKGEEWAVKEWLNHIVGKPKQAIELSGSGGGAISLEPAHLDAAREKFDQLIESAAAAHAANGGNGKNGSGKNGRNGSGRKEKQVKEVDDGK